VLTIALHNTDNPLHYQNYIDINDAPDPVEYNGSFRSSISTVASNLRENMMKSSQHFSHLKTRL